MDNSGYDCAGAKKIDMVDYLARFGHTPRYVKGNDYWYNSPLRDEQTPSFKVNRNINVWFDHGSGQGGTLIDFAKLFHGCTVSQFLSSLRTTLLSPLPSIPKYEGATGDTSIQVLQAFPLRSYPLINYLAERKIDRSTAQQYCCEVRYSYKGKEYYAIGFKNDKGGYEIRNKHIKTSSSPKAITHLQNGSTKLCVFEGFMDFLSFKILNPQLSGTEYDYLILNSTSFFAQSRPLMESYEETNLYLDNGKQGRKLTSDALSWSQTYKDRSNLYEGYDDMNDFHCNRKLSEVKPSHKKKHKRSI